jgi:D-proline reductase (dithiol) PrdB
MPVEPVRYVERLDRRYAAQGFPPYRWTINEAAPLAPLRRPVRESRVAMLTSGGVSRACDAPWDPTARNDFRVDDIPSDTAASAFQVHDSYYEVRSAREDINCVFPVDALRGSAADGTIGEVAPRLWSGFMGRIYKRTQLQQEVVPAWVGELRRDDVDLAVLVPA